MHRTGNFTCSLAQVLVGHKPVPTPGAWHRIWNKIGKSPCPCGADPSRHVSVHISYQACMYHIPRILDRYVLICTDAHRQTHPKYLESQLEYLHVQMYTQRQSYFSRAADRSPYPATSQPLRQCCPSAWVQYTCAGGLIGALLRLASSLGMSGSVEKPILEGWRAVHPHLPGRG